MTLDEPDCWSRLAGAGHGVLATVHPTRGVDAVPVVFVLAGGAILIPVDRVKPKRPGRLQRLRNIDSDDRCVLLVEHYADDWSQLWWVRVHARAAVSQATVAVAARFGESFAAYRAPAAIAEVISLHPTAVAGWAAT
ncbi:MAG TPA: pyridoxamine 5'-phosphate oxidase family protein [Acidimicrobiales bacterium]|nr:pyridoxamine 5'-phosphate oxidase family protein [Acidimicrobiales bacterium]